MMAMRDADGTHPIGLLKIFRDQTQARAAEQALETSRAELVQALVDNRKARAEAEAASHAKDRFLAILSHELRTPLTPVVMALHALERNAELPASLRGTVELIRSNVRAELMLIDDLLDVTRISSGKLEMSRAQTDMHEVVHAAADVCAGDFAAKRQRLGLALHAPRHVVPGDAARLQQVVWNLLKNAAKFTPERRRDQGRDEQRRRTASCSIVADTGIGIASEALPTIFDAFAQEGPWVTSEFGGLGLGLAIAKATVEAHHGSLVAAEQRPQPGRDLHDRAAARLTATVADERAPAARPARKRPMRIFVVENHEDTRFLLCLLLEQLGHTVFSAPTLADALAALPAAHCDVLISDIGLPDGNGWDLMARLGDDRPPYAIAMSGFGMSSDRQRSLNVGYRHHLLKPVEPNQLERLLDEAADETSRAAATARATT